MNHALPQTSPRARHSANRLVALAVVAVVAGMLGMAYAAVPLYKLFCQVTGFGGTTQRAETASNVVLSRQVTVHFDANTAPGLNWRFRAVTRGLPVRLGETGEAFYEITNNSDTPMVGTSTFNVTPSLSGAYFNKLDCFCFTEQLVLPGETVQLPVVFFVDPALDKDVDLGALRDITLSYTFFPVEKTTDELAQLVQLRDKPNERITPVMADDVQP